MLGNVTLGQYYPVASPVHALDPRTKLLVLVLLLIAVFIPAHIWCCLPIAAYLVYVTFKAGIPSKMMTRALRPLRFILLFTLVLNIFFLPGETVLLDLGFAQIKYEAVYTAVLYALRLVLLVMASSLLTFTTAPVALTDGLETLLSPLRRLHFPAHELAMMMTIALRFIPTLLEEADKIMKAQASRGADFDSGSLIARAKAMIPLLVPLFVSAFRRAGELAMAMEARCYHGGEGRTRMHVLKMQKSDHLAFVQAFAVLLLTIGLNLL